MKPHKTLIFILVVFVVLLDIALFFPEEGIKINDNITIKFATSKQLFEQDTVHYADISNILSDNEILNDSLIAYVAEKDSMPQDDKESFDTIRASANDLVARIQKLEFSDGINKELRAFFRSLESASKNGKLIRVMHYGDSQIEGDRITSVIRNKLQKRFGGKGVGLVPVLQPYEHSYSLNQENSDNWLRYTIYGKRDTTLSHNRYGSMGSFCTFTPSNDTTISETFTDAWVNYFTTDRAYYNTRNFNKVSIFYSHNLAPFMLEVKSNGAMVEADMYPASYKLQQVDIKMDSAVNNVHIKFSGYNSPDIYGIALDGNSGVAVDNIAMRGSSGLLFTKMDTELLRQMYRKLNVKLIILEYGGNVVPYINENHERYGKWFQNQIRHIKKAAPGVAIIVIGVADMSHKNGTVYESYPNLLNIRNAMREAAFNENVAYWDMLEAMGGLNSMPSWVFAEPPLASTDFVHFTPKGARIIGQMFYNALLYEYKKLQGRD